MQTKIVSLLAIAAIQLLATSARADPPCRWSPWSGRSYTLPSSTLASVADTEEDVEYAEPRANEGAGHHQGAVYVILVQTGWTPPQGGSLFSFPYAW